MKYYTILGIAQNGHSTATIKAKNKFDAIKEARKCCSLEKYVPVVVKRISKKEFNLISSINQ